MPVQRLSDSRDFRERLREAFAGPGLGELFEGQPG
jgi:hypothetical protein